MQVERVLVADIAVGDVVQLGDGSGWWSVDDVTTTGDGTTIELRAVDHDVRTTHRSAAGAMIVRGEPEAVHHVDEFLGLTRPEAQALAGALGWQLRDRSEPGWFTDDLRSDRINLWFDGRGHVERAQFG